MTIKANQFLGIVPKTIWNGRGVSAGTAISALSYAAGATAGSGDLSADTYPAQPQLEILGSGYLDYVAAGQASGGSLTLTCKLVIDGNEVIESSLSLGTSEGFIVLGFSYGNSVISPSRIRFSKSAAVYLKSSAAINNTATIYYSGGLY
ncbi:hypothetical protein [uncultured Desulfuromonas sp.]|uniref:hypothetical protein n=1 Tax=uncultured Desulfuromonas sp. TaxID=181013 RepID=UPI002AAA6B79|nr:hypothetical protein [uncultured Desulfuromonas sp.]